MQYFSSLFVMVERNQTSGESPLTSYALMYTCPRALLRTQVNKDPDLCNYHYCSLEYEWTQQLFSNRTHRSSSTPSTPTW